MYMKTMELILSRRESYGKDSVLDAVPRKLRAAMNDNLSSSLSTIQYLLDRAASGMRLFASFTG